MGGMWGGIMGWYPCIMAVAAAAALGLNGHPKGGGGGFIIMTCC